MRLMSQCRSSQCQLTLYSLVTLVTCGLTSAVVQGADISADKRLPKEVLLYVNCPSIPSYVTALKKTSLWELVHDPEMKAFKDHLVEKATEALKEAKDKIEFPVDQLPGLFAGEFTLALVKPFGEPLGGVGLMEIGSNRSLLDSLLAKIDSSSEEFSRANEAIQGQDVTICSMNGVRAWYFVKDGMLVVCSSVSLVEDVLARWDGKHEQTFAANPVFREIVAKCTSSPAAEGTISYFINPITLASTALSMSPDTAIAAAMVNGYLPALGLDTFKGIGGVSELNAGPYESISKTMFYNEPPARGIPRVFTLRETLSAPPAWVPEEAGQYIAFDWDLNEAYTAVKGMFETFLGPGSFEPMVDGLQKQPGAPNLHVKKDVIDALSGVFHMYVIPSDNPMDQEDITGVIAIGLQDEVKGKKIVAELLKSVPEDKVKTSQVKGITVYTPSDDDSIGAVAVAKNQIFLAASMEELEEALEGKTEDPLADSDAYKLARRGLPAAFSMFLFQDSTTQFEGAYAAAKKGDFNALSEGEINFSLLPSFEVVSKYLQPVMAFGRSDEHGYILGEFQFKRSR